MVLLEPITRTLMQKFDVPNSAYETVIMVVEMAPHVNSGLHTHPGFDSAYLLEGGLTVLELGKPDKPIRAGESWHVLPCAVHEVKIGARNSTVLAVYVVQNAK